MSDKRDHLAAMQDLVGIMRRQTLSAMRETDSFRDEAMTLRAENARLRFALESLSDSIEGHPAEVADEAAMQEWCSIIENALKETP